MYQKPEVQRFGSLRELTLLGITPNGDGGIQTPFGTVGDGPIGADRS